MLMLDPNNVVSEPSRTPLGKSIIGSNTGASEHSNFVILAGIGWAVLGSCGLLILLIYCWRMTYDHKEARNLSMVATVGALGGYVRCLHTFTRCFSQKDTLLPWAVSTFLTPLKSCLLAVIVAIVVKAGFITIVPSTAGAGVPSTNWVGLIGLGGLVGLFANEAVSKLEDIFRTIFGPPERIVKVRKQHPKTIWYK